MKRSALLALACFACGARSEVAGSGSAGSVDASISYDAGGVDASLPSDDAAAFDVAPTCTPTTTTIGCGGEKGSNCSTCKFDIEWTCGDVSYRIGGGCTPADGGGSDPGTTEGVCDENGAQTSTFILSTESCDCTDQEKLETLVRALCTHQ